MPHTITVEATYSSDADTVFAAALNPAEMKEAMRGIAVYEGLPDHDIAEGDTITVDVTMFGFLKTRGHHMYVERLDHAARLIQSREQNSGIRRWDHTLTVEPHGSGCLWRDRVVLDAGLLTFLTARFCSFVYTRRHRTRQAQSITAQIRRGEQVALPT